MNKKNCEHFIPLDEVCTKCRIYWSGKTIDIEQLQAENVHLLSHNTAMNNKLAMAQSILDLLDVEVRTAQLDMGGKHKYSISYTGQQRIGEAVRKMKN